MKEYIYLFIKRYMPLGKDKKGSERYLFENVGIPLSSRYKVECKKNIKKWIIDVKEEQTNVNYFSKYINDLVAVVGTNGSGKSSLLRLLMQILTAGMGNLADNVEYVLIFADNKQIKYKSTFKKNYVDVVDATNCDDLNYKGDYVIFYSPFFDNQISGNLFGIEGNFADSADISTTKLINVYSHNLHSHGLKHRNTFDRLDSYSHYEQLIELEFLANFLDMEKRLPMDLPKYMYVRDNYQQVKLLELELQESNVSALTKSINIWISKINQNFEDRIFLSIFATLYRRHNSDNYSTAIEKLNNIVKDKETIKIEEALCILSDDNIILKIRKFCKYITDNSKSTDNDTYIIFIKEQKDVLKKIMELHFCIKNDYLLLSPFLLFERQRLSTGEDNFIQFFARFYNIWAERRASDYTSGNKNIVFFIDEGEANFHPEWQRRYIKTLIEWIEIIMKRVKEEKDIPKFQIILSTHSPFVACDLPRNNMVRLKIKKDKSVKVELPKSENVGIGATIIDLLKDSFFLENTVGALAEVRIRKMIGEIREKGVNGLSTESKFVFNNLGDKFFKDFIRGGKK